jgi:hypothetical protein
MFGLRNPIIPKPTRPDPFGLPIPEEEKKIKMRAFSGMAVAPESPKPIALPEAKTPSAIPGLPASTLTPEKQRDALLEGLQGADKPLPTFDNRYDELKWKGGVDYGGKGGNPMAAAEWEHMTRGGKMDPTKPTGKDRLREALMTGLYGALQGMAQTGDWRGAIGGGAAGAAAGAISPETARAMTFEPQRQQMMQQEQERMTGQMQAEALRLGLEGKRAEIDAKGQHVLPDGTVVSRAGKVLYQPEAKPVSVGANGLYDPEKREIIPGTQHPQAPKIDTSTKYARQWNEETGKYEFIEDEKGQPLLSREYEQMAEREAAQNKRTAATNQTRITTAAMSQAGANFRHNNPSSKADQKTEQEKTQWLNALDNAIKSSNGDLNSPAIKNAIEHLQKFPDIETGIGDGGWPYAKRIASAPSTAKVFPAAQLEKYARDHGTTKEEATRYLQGLNYVIK